MLIRAMQLQELPAVARVYIDVFMATQMGIVSERFLQAVSYEVALQRLEGIFGGEERRPFGYVAEEHGTLTGFAVGGLAEKPPAGYQGELKIIYILPAYHRMRIGRCLLRAVAEHFAREMVLSMFLEVFADNIPARKFYETLGGLLLDEHPEEIRGERCLIAIYGWPSIHELLQAL